MARVDEMSEDTERLQAVIAPLGDEEEHTVREAVNRHMAQHSKRYRVLGPELLISKPARQGELSARELRALVVDYENGINVQILVQPDGGIIDAKPIDWQPSFAPEEVKEAREIAESDERLAAVAGQSGLTVIAFGPDRPAGATGRLIGLRYLATAEGHLQLIEVVVNLSTREIADLQQERGE